MITVFIILLVNWRPIRHVHCQNLHRYYQEPRIAVFYHVLHSAGHFRTSHYAKISE